MSSFQKLWESSKRDSRLGRDYWDQGPGDGVLGDNVLSLVKKGIEIRPDRTDGNTFWDDFLSIFGSNAEAAAELLDVSPDVISSWSNRVRRAVREAGKESKERATMLPTGN